MQPLLKNYDREKLIQSILYFAHHTRSLGKIKLFKLLFLLDFEHFRQTGRSVTGQEYRAWKMGPVPAGLVQEWDMMDDDLVNNIKIVPEQVFSRWRETVVPLQPFDPSHFTRRQLRLLDQLATQYKDAQSGTMIDVTHAENGAWSKVWNKKSENGDIIDYQLSIADDDEHREAVLDFAMFYQGVLAAQSARQHGIPTNA